MKPKIIEIKSLIEITEQEPPNFPNSKYKIKYSHESLVRKQIEKDTKEL